jgi:hypothetical protein
MVRDKIIFLSRKLAIWIFLGMFMYLLASSFLKSYDLLPEFAIVFFFVSFFFFGLIFLPPKLSKEYMAAWLMFISLMFIAIGGGVAFILTFVFEFSLNNLYVTLGVIFFMVGIIMTIFSVVLSGGHRNQNETADVEKSFREFSKKYNLNFENMSNFDKLYLKGEGNLNIGYILTSVENEYPIGKRGLSFNASSKKLPINTSKIELTTSKKNEYFRVLTANEAIQIDGLNEPFKTEAINFIKEKKLNFFNFGIYSKGNQVFFSVDVAIEELELWEDYLKFIDMLIINN